MLENHAEQANAGLFSLLSQRSAGVGRIIWHYVKQGDTFA